MKRDSMSAYVHMRRYTPYPFTELYAFWMNSPIPHELHPYLNDVPFLIHKTYKDIRVSRLLKHKHLKK